LIQTTAKTTHAAVHASVAISPMTGSSGLGSAVVPKKLVAAFPGKVSLKI